MTDKKKEKFIRVLRESGNVSASARVVGISRNAAYAHKKNDLDFSERWDEAYDESVDSLELEARRRAVEGWEEPIVYQGEITGTIRKYSDTLLIFLLKGARPDKYRDNYKLSIDWQDEARRDGYDPEILKRELIKYFVASLVANGIDRGVSGGEANHLLESGAMAESLPEQRDE